MKIILAGCMLQNDQGEVILLHRKSGKIDQWEVPGGKLEALETPENAAVRELLEELGLEVEIVSKVGIAHFTHGENTFEYHYFAANTEGTPKIIEQNTFTEWAYVPAKLNQSGKNFSSGATELFNLLESRQGND